MKIHAYIDYRVRLRQRDIPCELKDHFYDALTLDNLERQDMKERGIPGWSTLPEHFELWDNPNPNDDIFIPRGFRHVLDQGLSEYGHEVIWHDRRYRKAHFRAGKAPRLRPYQIAAKDRLIAAQDAIYQAPPGSGKTVMALGLIRQLAMPACVIVNTTDIAAQWKRLSDTHLGPEFPVGIVGDRKMQVSRFLTVATVQTLYSRYDELEAQGFFDRFGVVICDECHHATADTYMQVINRFSSLLRFGMSGTPEKTGDFRFAEMYLGPIFHETKRTGLVEEGILVKPTIYRVMTDFYFPYTGNDNGNYNSLLTSIAINLDRNMLIAKTILSESCRENRNLVLSKRLAHHHELEIALRGAGYSHPIMHYTGKESSEKRMEIQAKVAERPCTVLSTLAEEAVDIPPLDRIHLVWPQRNTDLIAQQIGRGERSYPGKTDCLVFDYVDKNVGVLKAQWNKRRRALYNPRKLKVNKFG